MDSIEVSVIDILKTLLRRWWIIVICAIFCAVALFLYSKFYITPMYGLTTQFYVTPEFGGNTVNSAATATQTQTFAQAETKTYIKLLENADFFDELEENIRSKGLTTYSAGRLSSMISHSELSDTTLFVSTIISAKPQDAYTIATSLAEIAPKRIQEIKGFKALQVTNEPKFERIVRVNDVTRRNTVIGALFGAMVSAFIIIVIKVFDVRIIDESDLARLYSVPILGVIPDFEEVIKDNKKSGYGGRYGENVKK